MRLIAAAALSGSIAFAGATTASAQPQHRANKPTIVVVHGAWADPSSFGPQIKALQAQGYKVLAAPNPVQNVATDTEAVARFIKQRTHGPVVLVGHSYGGFVMSGVHDPDVKALVYIDAYAPVAGESAAALNAVKPGSSLNVPDVSTVLDLVKASPTAPESDTDSYIKQDKFRKIFAASLSRQDASLFAAGQSPAKLGALEGKFSGTPAWSTTPSWYFVGSADRVIPKAEQLAMAHRAHSHVVVANAPHLAMIATPKKVTQLIIRAARHVG